MNTKSKKCYKKHTLYFKLKKKIYHHGCKKVFFLCVHDRVKKEKEEKKYDLFI